MFLMLFPLLNSGSNRACMGGDHCWVNFNGNMLRNTLRTLRAHWEVLKAFENIRRTFANSMETLWDHQNSKNQNLLKFNFEIILKIKSKLKILIKVGCVGLGIIFQEKLDLALKWMGLIFGNILLVDLKLKNIPFDKKIKKKNSKPQNRQFLWKQRTNQHW